MYFTSFENEYTIGLGQAVIFTEDLPYKWTCAFVFEDDQYRLKLNLLSTGSVISTYHAFTDVHVTALFHISGTGSRYRPALPYNFNLYNPDNDKAEIVIDLDIARNGGRFGNKLKLMFKVYVPKHSSCVVSGYDFTAENSANDQILVVGNKKFHVNKAVLSAYSPFFNNLFNNPNFEESKKGEIELRELNATWFEYLLQVIFPTTKTVESCNVEELWELADRFSVASVAKMCEDFLCNIEGEQSGHLTIVKRMKIAQKYNSEKLMNILVKQMERMKI